MLSHSMIQKPSSTADLILLGELLRLRRKHLQQCIESCCATTQFSMPKYEAAQHDSAQQDDDL